MSTYEITEIQLFGDKAKYSANIAINDKFMLQRGTDGKFSIPRACDAQWKEARDQDMAYESIDAAKLARQVKARSALKAAMKHSANWFWF